MKNHLFIILLFLSIFSTSKVQALECGTNVEEALRTTYPRYQFQEVNSTPVPGICEVVSTGNITYFAQETGHLIFGEIWSPLGNNITQEKKASLLASKLEALPLDNALKIGDGEKTVIEVTDPDCPFCRKGSTFLDTRRDVTRYIFFKPLTNLHPEAGKKARYILAAQDKAAAYKEIMSGKYDGKALPEFEDNGLLDHHIQAAASLGINATPYYWVDGQPVAGANIPKLKELLEQ